MSVTIPTRAIAKAPAPAAPPTAKAGPVGPGAGVLMTEYLLPTILGTQPQDRMAKALKLGMDVDWVRAAERVISGKVAACEWHLEDPDGETIDDEYPDALAVAAYRLLESPQSALPLSGTGGIGKRQTRRQQMGITSRHMGLAGQGAWFLDSLNAYGHPGAIIYVRPDRLTPAMTEKGVLTGWVLDKRPGFAGIPIPVEQLLLFQLQVPDGGVFGPGLVESSMAKAINNGLIDRHFSTMLASGGRISGILAPKEGAITDDGVYQQLIRDWRNITEQPDAARRLQLVRAPVDFTSTVQTVGEMQIIDLMYHNRDALLALWGVPLSMLGGATSSGGLNSGETRKYDEAALWQGAVHDRIVEIQEGIQTGILDKWEEGLGWAPKLVFDEPEFDDELPNFDKLAKAAGTPLRNSERRAIIGLDPFGDPYLDNAIWMPVNVVAMSVGTDPDTGKIPPEPERPEDELEPDDEEEPEEDEQGIREVSHPAQVAQQPFSTATKTPAKQPKSDGQGGNVTAGGQRGAGPARKAHSGVKASMAAEMPYRVIDVGVVRLRERMDETVLPRAADTVQEALRRQAAAIASHIEARYEAIKRHGGRDTSMYFTEQDAELLERALKPTVAGVAEATAAHIVDAFRD